MTPTPIRTGLIGFGLSGQVFHAPFLLNDPAFTLAAVVSRQTEKIRELAPAAEPVATLEALLSRDDIELVVITTPNELHYPQAKAALAAGKHVLLEKPAVTRIEQMEELTALAAAQQRVLTVFQNRRFDGDFQYLAALIQRKALGALRHLDIRFDRFRPQPRDRWREKNVEGGGIFWDLGPHLMDQALQLLGPPQQISACLRTLRANSEATDWFAVQLRYPQAQVTLGSTPFEAGDMRRFNARFDAGSWQCWGLDPQEAALRAGQSPGDKNYPDKGEAQQARLSDGDVQQTVAVPKGDYAAFYAQLGHAIREDGTPPVTPAEAKSLLVALQLAEQSAREGRVLDWSE